MCDLIVIAESPRRNVSRSLHQAAELRRRRRRRRRCNVRHAAAAGSGAVEASRGRRRARAMNHREIREETRRDLTPPQYLFTVT